MIIFFDTETSGLYPGEICQLSYVFQTNTSVYAKNFYFSVSDVEYGAYMVHGLSVDRLRLLSSGIRFCDKAAEISEDFRSADLIVGHNVKFDIAFLTAEFNRCNIDFTPQKTFCSMQKTAKFCKIARKSLQGYKYPKLSELCDHYGVRDVDVRFEAEELFGYANGFHDAKFDVTATYLAVNKAIKAGDLSGLSEYL